MEQVRALDQALANTTRLLQGITDDQWDQPTPCAKWDVRQLVTHTAGVMANFANGAAGEPIAGDPDDYDIGNDPGSMMAELSARNVAAWAARGELDSMITLGEEDLPGLVAININALDAYMHGWDLAKATGQEPMLDAEFCAGLLVFAREILPVTPRDGDNFSAVVDTGPNASPADQLVAYLGRQP